MTLLRKASTSREVSSIILPISSRPYHSRCQARLATSCPKNEIIFILNRKGNLLDGVVAAVSE
ncbi:1988_t:CDS:2 [Funneliformis mosseae]|uniref:1988_t:CDS:1 n=1 Tax=Funneliformis mosseae TaxID=27381 RepID=A0A9N9DZ90_FUNMO|nr:1988_t:CDS:2 [Funneliformis mosseae]